MINYIKNNNNDDIDRLSSFCMINIFNLQYFVLHYKNLEIVLCKHGEIGGEIRESCEQQVCHRIICKGYERKKEH